MKLTTELHPAINYGLKSLVKLKCEIYCWCNIGRSRKF